MLTASKQMLAVMHELHSLGPTLLQIVDHLVKNAASRSKRTATAEGGHEGQPDVKRARDG